MIPSSKIAIIADDITGATDTGIQFVKAGMATTLLGCLDYLPMMDPRIDALAINTDSRALLPQDAHERVLEAILTLKRHGYRHFYQKIDSTLRGNPGAEIDAAMRAGGHELAVVAPSAPRNGRKVVGGICYVNDTALAASEAGRDPFTPLKYSSVAEIITAQTGEPVGHVDLDTLRRGDDAALGRTAALLKTGARVVLFDAATCDDLRLIARIPFQDLARVLYVGSSGLAEYLPEPRPERSGKLKLVSKKIAFLVGSLMETALRQSQFAVTAGRASEILVDVDQIALEADYLDRILSRLKSLHRHPESIILRTKGGLVAEGGRPPSAEKRSVDRHRIGAFLGQIARAMVADLGVTNIFATGGDTFRHLAEALNIPAIELVEEVLPGIPAGRGVVASTGEAINIITKSGGFGDEETFVKIMDFINRRLGE
jgi:uncharacterized protein YgbK (DUF1537 family)